MNTQSLTMAENILQKIALKTGSTYIVGKSPLQTMINQEPNFIMRNIKRSAAWEIADEVEDEIMTKNSKIRQNDYLGIIDNIGFGTIIGSSTEMFGLDQLIVNLTRMFNIPETSDLYGAFVVGVIRVVFEYGTDQLNNELTKGLKNMTSFIGLR